MKKGMSGISGILLVFVFLILVFGYGSVIIENAIYTGRLVTGWTGYDNGCSPSCSGKVCGGDGCGGSCGSCPSGQSCSGGQCVSSCVPSCTGKSCGSDGCSGSCGSCPLGQSCSNGNCILSDCTPSCTDKECGDDGCGGSCGGCDIKGVSDCAIISCMAGKCVGDGYKTGCSECSETDFDLSGGEHSGNNPLKRGSLSSLIYGRDGNIEEISKIDYCNGNNLKEYYCDVSDNSVRKKNYVCEFGCSAGQCISCKDTDGPSNPNKAELLQSYNIFGNVREIVSIPNYQNYRQDACLSSDSLGGFEYESDSGNKLLEFYCGWGASNLITASAIALCDCENGKCSSVQINGVSCGDNYCSVGVETCTNCQNDCGVCPLNCGDGTCDIGGGETCFNCPQDCDSCTRMCGDGVCNGDESCSSCSSDCGNCNAKFCGDGNCNSNEDCGSCRQDCGICEPLCGDGSCNGAEDCSVCSSDCGTCGSECGDSVCDSNENCLSCSDDCTVCGLSCGDGICDETNGESCSSCADDCGTCNVQCGDGTCNSNEDCLICSGDCGDCTSGCGDGICSENENEDNCADDCGDVADEKYCGDRNCDVDEDCYICSKDCGGCSEEELMKVIEGRIDKKIVKGGAKGEETGGLSNLFSEKNYFNSGIVIGILTGVLIFILLVGGFLLYLYLKNRKKRKNK